MDLGLQGKVAVVTGGGSGIALRTIEMLLDEGAAVVTADRDISRLEGRDVRALEADLTDPAAPGRLIDVAVRQHGRVDILVNAVGGPTPRQGFTDISDEEWQRALELNFLCMMRASRAAIEPMRRAGGGAIVSIASDAGREPEAHFVDYGVAKAAVMSLSKALAHEYAPEGIRSNVVSPGPTRTDGFVGVFGRIAEAWVILFLCSDIASNVTGSDYRVDGGIIRSV